MSRQIGPIAGALLGMALLQPAAFGQDAAWEGLINAGRNALQQKKFSEAERHFESALEAAENFPSGDARLGKSYNNLAAAYYAQEDFERAEPLMRRALAALRETLGPENTEVAQTMKNLAALYYLQGNRSEAEALLKQSLEILERVHGPNHAFVATVLSNLAGLYQSEDRYGDAEPLLTRSLRIWESLLGSDHPDVVRSRTLLAQVREAQRGEQVLGTATAAVNPRASVPSSATDAIPPGAEIQAFGDDANDELAKARTAIEELTQLSKIEAEKAKTESVPVPALSPIGDVANADVTNANAESETAGSLEEVWGPETPPAPAGQGSTVAEVESGTPAPEPPDGARDAADIVAAVILDEAKSADDVSFAIYLSTLWSIDEARRYWQAMQNAMPDVLGGKQMEIEEVAAAGGAEPFYRVLTTPYTSDPEAQAACELIKSKLRTHDCAVVVREAATDG